MPIKAFSKNYRKTQQNTNLFLSREAICTELGNILFLILLNLNSTSAANQHIH